MRRFIPYLITAIVFSTLAFGAGQVLGMKQKSVDSAAFIMSGRLAVNEKDLRNMVAAKNLTVYWLGPEAGAKYLLDTSLADGISLRVIYASASTGSTAASETYYEVGTFASPDAFALTQKLDCNPMEWVLLIQMAMLFTMIHEIRKMFMSGLKALTCKSKYSTPGQSGLLLLPWCKVVFKRLVNSASNQCNESIQSGT